MDDRRSLQKRHHRSEGGINAGLVIPIVLAERGAHPLGNAVRADVTLQLGMRIQAVGDVCLLSARASSPARYHNGLNNVCGRGCLRSDCPGSSGLWRRTRASTSVASRTCSGTFRPWQLRLNPLNISGWCHVPQRLHHRTCNPVFTNLQNQACKRVEERV